MSNKQLRNVVRLVHLAIAVIIAAFVYSPLRLNDTFTAIIQLIVIPVLIVSGIVMWQQPLVIKWLNRGRGQEQGKGA
jgi:thiosulfate reductase cytochrome b subunit